MRQLLILLFVFFTIPSFSQGGFYLSAGAGVAHITGKIEPIKESFDSYLTLTARDFPNDPVSETENFKNSEVRPLWCLQSGYQGTNFLVGLVIQNYDITQTREAIRQSGYGRSFTWNEKRNHILVDMGWSKHNLAISAIFGMDLSKFTMGSYQVYPDGTRDIGNSFTYNGNFRSQASNITGGLGVKYIVKKYVAIDLRYLYSASKLPGESDIGTGLTLTDNSLSRLGASNASTEFPADWTQTFSLDNAIEAKFARNFIQLTVSANIFIND